MSKVVTIPECMRPNFVCEINGRQYSYPAGTTQEVPDEVAEVIENHKNHRVEQPKMPVYNQSMNIRPNFAQNNPDAQDYIKNRPFYENKEAAVIGDAITEKVTVFANGNVIRATAQPKIGGQYIVVYDGKEYPCECINPDDPRGGKLGATLGNPALRNAACENTGEPFGIGYTYIGYNGLFIYGDGGEHTIQVFNASWDVVPMDAKFVHDTIARLDDLPNKMWKVPYATGTTVSSSEFNALIDALINAGYMVS